MTDNGRPGVITLIGIVIWIQAGIAAIVGFAGVLLRNNSDFQANIGLSADQLLINAIGELALAALLVIVAFGLMSGSRGARTFIAIVMAARVGYSVWVMISHTGGAVAAAAVTIAISLFVLWALYDHKDASAYFA